MRVPQLTTLLFTAALAAQTAHTTPNPPSPANVDRPFGGGIGRYQQWYSAASMAAGFTTPMRIELIEFFAGTSQSSNATTLDMEVRVSHGKSLGLTGAFDTNYADVPLIVLPRQNVQLLAGAPGAVVMTIPFATRFTWDRVRPVLVEIKIFGNSRGNQPFAYNHRGTTSGSTTTHRVYQAGSAGATNGVSQQGIGLVTRFTARPGAIVPFGAGCPGQGGFVPVNTVVAVPYPGLNWQHQLTQASSQRLCIWVIGDSNSQWGPVTLPADIGTMLGMAPNFCSLNVNPVSTVWTTTVGGGPGSGSATVAMQLPAVTFYIGMSLYTQWLVADPLSPNQLLSATPGMWSIVAPVGG